MSRKRALLHDLAGIHHRDAVADLDGDPDVVGDEDDGHAELALQLAQQQQDLDLHGGIERGGRLVRQQDLGPAGERQRDHRALAHAAGHLVRIGIEPAFCGGNAHDLEHFQRARPALRIGSCPRAASRSRRSARRWCRPDRAPAPAPERSSTRSGRGTPTVPRRSSASTSRPMHVDAARDLACASSATAASARARSRSCPNRTRRAGPAPRRRRARG